jgi:hypothetical protein
MDYFKYFKMNKVIIVAIAALALVACKGKKKSSVRIYPITSQIAENIKLTDSLYTAFFYVVNGKDTTPKGNAFFKEFSKKFLTVDLTSRQFDEMYKERTFNDQTNGENGTATFTYDATDAKAPYKSYFVTVDSKTQQYKSAYFEKVFMLGDTAVKQNLLWTFNEACAIITTKSIKGSLLPTVAEKLVWNFAIEK